MAGGDAAPAFKDVALLDRFEVLVDTGAGDRLEQFDISTGRTVVVDARPFTVLGHGGLIWWSTGTEDALTWHALDLARLT